MKPKLGSYVNFVIEVPSEPLKYSVVYTALEKVASIIRGEKVNKQTYNELTRAVKVAREYVKNSKG